MRDLSFVIKLLLIEKKDIFYSIIFGFCAGIAAVGIFSASGYMISKSALESPVYALAVMIALVKLFGLARALGRYAERYFSHRATFTMLSHLRISFYEKIEPFAPRIFQTYRSGDLLARIVGDVESLQHFFLRVYYPPLVLVLVFFSTILFISFYSFYVAMVLLLGLLLTGFVVPAFFAVKQRKMDKKIRMKRALLSTDVTELMYGFRDLKIYQKLEEIEQRLMKTSDDYICEQEKDGVQAIYNHSLNMMVTLIISWFVLLLSSYMVTAGYLDGLFLAMLVMASLTVFENATPMAVLPGHLENSRYAAARLSSLIQEEHTKENESKIEMIDPQEAMALRMKDVTFAFSDDSWNALDHVSFSFPSGSKTAIVGPSGSGKSTLLQLLLKFHTINKGEIYFDSYPIALVSQEEVWKRANVVLQENHFFFGTIRDNLMIAKEGLIDDDMEKALMKVKLEHFSLEDPVFEKGANLSGGEKQRLAVARAMLKGERLWLLDEPTSSVDALTEQSIYEHIFRQAKNDTLILISHRLTGLEKMDQIIVLEKGKLIEVGTYHELMEKKGYFYQLKQIEQSVFM